MCAVSMQQWGINIFQKIKDKYSYKEQKSTKVTSGNSV